MRNLRLIQREPAVTTLGPGQRYCFWTAGCNRRCPGCTTPESHDGSGYEISPAALALEIALSAPDGVTISGGEPFLQAEAVAETIRSLRQVQGCDIGVIVYTGYRIEELADVPGAAALLAQTDLLIDGPYVRELDDGGSLRGSSNQRVIPLTPRYDTPEVLALYGAPERRSEYFFHGSGVSRVGVIDHASHDDDVMHHFPVSQEQ